MSWPPKLYAPDASRYLQEVHGIKRTVQTLAKLRCYGGGPRFYPGSGKPLYALSDLDEWAKEKIGKPVGAAPLDYSVM